MPFRNYEKKFLFHPKNSFRSQDIQIIGFSSSPLFYQSVIAVEFDLRKILRVDDAVNCQFKNSITHFVRYLEKEISCDIEPLPIDRALDTEYFYGKTMHKMCTKS